MKLIDLLVQELPKRGGWPTKTNDVLVLRPFMFEHKIEFTATPGSQWFSDAYFQLVSKGQYEDALAASRRVEWSGEGLPPVSCEFEYGTHRSVAKCIAVSHHHVFASKGDPDDENSDYEEFLIDIGHSSFYPLSTEAERKRDEAIKQMMDCSAVLLKVTAGLIYDEIAAGKIPGIKLVD